VLQIRSLFFCWSPKTKQNFEKPSFLGVRLSAKDFQRNRFFPNTCLRKNTVCCTFVSHLGNEWRLVQLNHSWRKIVIQIAFNGGQSIKLVEKGLKKKEKETVPHNTLITGVALMSVLHQNYGQD